MTHSRSVEGRQFHAAYTVAEMTLLEFEAVPAVTRRRADAGARRDEVRRHLRRRPGKLKRVAERLVAARESGAKVVGVLSAMG